MFSNFITRYILKMGSFKDHVSNVKIIFFDGFAVFSL